MARSVVASGTHDEGLLRAAVAEELGHKAARPWQGWQPGGRRIAPRRFWRQKRRSLEQGVNDTGALGDHGKVAEAMRRDALACKLA